MRKYIGFVIVVLMFIFLVELSMREDRKFHDRMREDITTLEERLREDGMPPSQIASITSTLNSVGTNVVTHVSSRGDFISSLVMFYLAMGLVGLANKINDRN